MKYFVEKLKFGFKRQWWGFIGLGIVVVLVIVLFALTRRATPPDWWTWIDMGATAATLIVAAMVWLAETAQDWERSLPKRLTAVFLYRASQQGEPKPILVCENATLITEDDIRGMAQQMGSQIVEDRNLDFGLHLETPPPRIVKIVEDGKQRIVRSYEIHYLLNSLPLALEDLPRQGQVRYCTFRGLAESEEHDVPVDDWKRASDGRWIYSPKKEKSKNVVA